MNNTTLSVIAKSTKVAPPPTKREIAAAMLERARIRFAKEKKEEKNKREALTKKLDIEAKKALKAYLKRPDSHITVGYCYECSAELKTKGNLDFKQYPGLMAAQKELQSLPCLGWNEAEVRKEIAATLDTTGPRIAAMLANKEACEALDKMLPA